MTQANLARSAGISRTALSLIENGRLRPSMETAHALDRALDPLSAPTMLRCGRGAMGAAELVRKVAREFELEYALTADVAAWLLTRYQKPGAAWAYVRPLDDWADSVRRRGARRPRGPTPADLVLLRAPEEVLGESRMVGGFRVVAPGRLLQDCARLGGRRALDAARVYVEFPEARLPGLRLDADALLKVFEHVGPRTSRTSNV